MVLTRLQLINGRDAVLKYPDRNLLTVWPCYDNPWAYDALNAFSGEYVCYVGEGSGGCTATDDFHELLDTKFNEVQVDATVPQFWGVHDYLSVWHRRPKRAVAINPQERGRCGAP